MHICTYMCIKSELFVENCGEMIIKLVCINAENEICLSKIKNVSNTSDHLVYTYLVTEKTFLNWHIEQKFMHFQATDMPLDT